MKPLSLKSPVVMTRFTFCSISSITQTIPISHYLKCRPSAQPFLPDYATGQPRMEACAPQQGHYHSPDDSCYTEVIRKTVKVRAKTTLYSVKSGSLTSQTHPYPPAPFV